ncbi:MAG: PAS domain S-box protein [Candidatus Brocadiaceae bacterium]|nr:PAS domain S-box protein [Candidatus Brocadiaceae bacterium]
MSLLIVFLVTLTCMLFFIKSKKQFEDEHEKLGISLVTLLSKDDELKYALNHAQPIFLESTIRKLMILDREDEIGYWRVSDTQRILLEEKALWTNIDIKDIPVIKNSEDTELPMVHRVHTSSGEEFHDFSIPVPGERMFSGEVLAAQFLEEDCTGEELNPSIVGFVQIGLTTRRLTEKLQSLILYSIIPTALSAAVGGFCITFFLNKYMVLPLQKLTFVTKDIAKGNLDNEVSVGSRDEIGQLSMNFNKMTESLKSTYKELRKEIKQHKQTAVQLHKLSQAVEQSTVAIVITDTDGKIEYVNPRFTELTGYDRKEIVGKTPGILKSGETSPEKYKRLWETIVSGKEWYGEFHNKKKDGDLYWEQAIISPIRNTESVVTHYVAIKEDITQRKQIESELVERSKSLARSNAELEQFAYIVSHDLQEPLRKIIAFSGRLHAKYGSTLNEEGRDYIGRMQKASQRMQTLIIDLLSYSRVNTKSQPFCSIDLVMVVKDVLSDLEVKIEQTGASIEVGELPVIKGDPLQMRQLFQNLIGNALKFQRKGKPSVVKIREVGLNEAGNDHNKLSQGSSLCRIAVEDNGIGFEEKYSNRIFGVFQRLHGRGEYEGTGIGLSICQKIVERHGGTIKAKSKPDTGATFIIELPRNGKNEMRGRQNTA